RDEVEFALAAAELADRVGGVLRAATLAVADPALPAGLGRILAAEHVRVGNARADRRALAHHFGLVAGQAGPCAGNVAADPVGAEIRRALGALGARRPLRTFRAAGLARA